MSVSGARVIPYPSEADEHVLFIRLYDFRLKCSIDEQIQENNTSGRCPHLNAPACPVKKCPGEKFSMSMNNLYFLWFFPSIVWTSSSPGADEDA